MAIAFDAQSFRRQDSVSTVTLSHTCTGSDLILIVGISHFSGADRVSTMTYNGVSMTKINAGVSLGGGGIYSTLWYLINPSTGANNIVATLTGTYSNRMGGSSYTGAKQSGQPDSNNTNTTGSGSSLTTSTTVVASNCWLVMVGTNDSGTAISAGTGTTLRGGGATSDNLAMFDSNGTVGTGSQSLQHSQGSASAIGAVIASIAPTVASGPTTVKTWDGVTQSTGIKTYEDVALASVKSVIGAT